MAILRDDVLESAIAEKVQAAIADAGVAQYDLADQIGLTSNQVSDRMHGKTRWSIVELYAVAEVLRMSARDLLP